MADDLTNAVTALTAQLADDALLLRGVLAETNTALSALSALSALAGISASQETLATEAAEGNEIINAIKVAATNSGIGIYTAPAYHPYSFAFAASVVALRNTGILQQVLDEMDNPSVTPPS